MENFLSKIDSSVLELPPNWIPPVPGEMRALKEDLIGEEATILEMSERIGASYKFTRNAFSDSAYSKGTRVDFCIWRLWLEMLNVVEPYKLKPKLQDVHENVFSRDNFVLPTISEFQYIVKRSGLALDTLAKYLYMPPDALKSILNVTQTSKLADEFTITEGIWFDFLRDIRFPTHESLYDPENVLIDETSLLDFRTGEYTPPHPRSLRRFIAYTGYSAQELCDLICLPSVGRFVFYASNRSMRNNLAFTEGVFRTSDNWVAPALTDLRLFCILTRQETIEMCHALKLDKKLVLEAFDTPDNQAWKREPLTGILTQELWLNYVDSKVKHVNQLFKKLDKENKVVHIPYPILRMLLSIFGLIEQKDYFHKF